jgi:hypothetical protein
MPNRKNAEETQDQHPEDPSPGSADVAREFDASEEPEDTHPDDVSPAPRPAPAPGLPVSEREYQRLKDEAQRGRNQDDVPAQEDRPAKKRH